MRAAAPTWRGCKSRQTSAGFGSRAIGSISDIVRNHAPSVVAASTPATAFWSDDVNHALVIAGIRAVNLLC